MTKPLRCPECGGTIWVETSTYGSYYPDTVVDGIECENYECGAKWDREGDPK